MIMIKELGKEYHYIKQNTKEVKKGVLVQLGIDKNSGYGLSFFIIEEKIDRIEDSLVFATEQEANTRLEEITPIMDKATAFSKLCDETLKGYRESIIGKPEFEGIFKDGKR